MSDHGTPGKIALLPPEVADQIAAGEVVERPASVVKELVENALDAGARVVSVTVDGGGLSRIAVRDDGAGMLPDDLVLAVVRHATSKIRVADDLIGVGTYGFRGEALPSIGSVSRMKLTSRIESRDEGAEVLVEGGKVGPLSIAGCAVGTTVSVDDLFYNTPARRKFLRTPQTEWAACMDAVVRLALPRPDVRFVVRRDGKTARELLRHDSVVARAREVYADENLVELSGTRHGVKVTGLFGPPERARSGANAVALYVNGRHVRDRLLLRAIAQAYGSTLENGRYPVGALLVEVPAADVDVNVHPQKNEVRFATQNGVFEAIVSVLRAGLVAAPWAQATAGGGGGGGVTGISGGASPSPATSLWTDRFAGGPRSNVAAEVPAGLLAALGADPLPPFVRPLGAFVAPSTEPDPWGLTPRPPYPPAAYSEAAAPAAPPTPPSEPAAPVTPQGALPLTPQGAPSGGGEDLLGRGAFARLHYVAQLRRMFLVCESDAGMVILDQHAAAERVTFDRLRKAYAARSVSVQQLLVPERIEVTARDLALVEEGRKELDAIGFELSQAGPSTVAIRAVPALLSRADPRRLARDVLVELGRHGNDFSRAMDLVLATMACHGSVRAGDALADEEARALLRAMDEVDFAGHCPHGRPVVWSMRWTELERRVGR